MTDAPGATSAEREPSDGVAATHDLATLLLAAYFVGMILVVIALLVVPVVL
jgi:hypothetical protein